MRVKTPKTETIAEYLARGGRITKIPSGDVAPVCDNFVGPNRKPKKELDYNDMKDGLSPNLRWIGGRE